MKELTNAIATERDNSVNAYSTIEPSGAIMRLQQVIVAHADDDPDEDDGYWHP